MVCLMAVALGGTIAGCLSRCSCSCSLSAGELMASVGSDERGSAAMRQETAGSQAVSRAGGRTSKHLFASLQQLSARAPALAPAPALLCAALLLALFFLFSSFFKSPTTTIATEPSQPSILHARLSRTGVVGGG